MVQVRRAGLSDPKVAFDELRPFRNKLIAMMQTHRPFGSDYLILEAVTKALDTAAYHFTRDPDFFALKPEQSRSG